MNSADTSDSTNISGSTTNQTKASEMLQPLPALNLTASAIAAIEGLISSRGLAPGDPLPSENQLSQELQISRSAVREAIGQLQALDIVSAQRGRGTFVGGFSLEPLIRILLLRSSLDPQSTHTLREVVAVRLILDRGFASTIVEALRGKKHPELHEIVETMRAQAALGDTFFEADIAFHRRLFSYGPTLLAQLASAMWEIHMKALRTRNLPIGNLKETAEAHGQMLAAAESGDVDAYLAAVSNHYAPLLDSVARAD